MDAFVIEGGRRLDGRIRVNGSKNAALPLMAACLLTDRPLTLRGVPDLADIGNMLRLLAELGVEVAGQPGGGLCDSEADGPAGTPPSLADAPADAAGGRGAPCSPGCSCRAGLTLTSTDPARSHARYDIVRTMRASICALGPMLARRGQARVSMPGGCAIGDRPVDLHLKGLRALGAEIELDGGDIRARVPSSGRLRGATVFLGGPFGSTVLGTANIMSAATLAEGATTIESAACEPEVVDLANMLNAMGARITGAGSPRITIEGVGELGPADHEVIPDRIEAGTFICAAAITNGQLILERCPLDCLMAARAHLEQVGVQIENLTPDADPLRTTVRVSSPRVLNPITVTTQPHPGFPTDLQAQLMALLCLADGNSVVTEKIFPERFLHVAELSRMGASLHRQGATVVVTGVRQLTGAPVMASDLRASAGLVLAGMAARGRTVVNRVYHLDRGYEQLEQRLGRVGAHIERTADSA